MRDTSNRGLGTGAGDGRESVENGARDAEIEASIGDALVRNQRQSHKSCGRPQNP
jgi:hypothetical protein